MIQILEMKLKRISRNSLKHFCNKTDITDLFGLVLVFADLFGQVKRFEVTRKRTQFWLGCQGENVIKGRRRYRRRYAEVIYTDQACVQALFSTLERKYCLQAETTFSYEVLKSVY